MVRCVCTSIRPGSTVNPPRSTTLSPGIAGTEAVGAIAWIVSPTTTIVCPSSSFPVFTSSKCPARTRVRFDSGFTAGCAERKAVPIARDRAIASLRFRIMPTPPGMLNRSVANQPGRSRCSSTPGLGLRLSSVPRRLRDRLLIESPCRFPGVLKFLSSTWAFYLRERHA